MNEDECALLYPSANDLDSDGTSADPQLDCRDDSEEHNIAFDLRA